MILKPQVAAAPSAAATERSRPFWTGCDAGELRFQRCDGCGAAVFPPSGNCRSCLGGDLQWVASSGHAVLYSWTVVWRPVTKAFEAPYVPAIVDVDEGFQMLTNLVGLELEDIVAAMPLQVTFHRVDGALTLPYFMPRARA
ncbi:Zn-ribbon domain-containing OB-fold protein [Frankia gtarii]|uniref:Zn-ribbon domain-containing OB-fold protein n=1 Tax=Frankia gtarii TaxID=2950102 RepID=UPI0021C06F9D|nr:OB-fold domain-containing protein [Frankia gtarii]